MMKQLCLFCEDAICGPHLYSCPAARLEDDEEELQYENWYVKVLKEALMPEGDK